MGVLRQAVSPYQSVHALQVPPRGAQAKDYALLVQAVGVFGHGHVQYGFLFHAILSHLPR